MKTLLIALSLFVSFHINAQTEVNFLNAIGSNDLSNIESYLSAEVTYSVDDNQKTISKAQTAQELRSFFSTNKITKFKLLHNGQSSDSSSSYRVARLSTKEGSYRIFAYAEDKGGKAKIIEIRLDSM